MNQLYTSHQLSADRLYSHEAIIFVEFEVKTIGTRIMDKISLYLMFSIGILCGCGFMSRVLATP